MGGIDRERSLDAYASPQEISDGDIARVRFYISQGKSTAASVALTIADETQTFIEQQYHALVQELNNPSLDRKVMVPLFLLTAAINMPSQAILSLEEVLRDGSIEIPPWPEEVRTYIDNIHPPGTPPIDWETRQAVSEARGILSGPTLVNLAKETKSPLDFVDKYVENLMKEYAIQEKDIEMTLLERGRQRFHALYNSVT